MSESFEDIPVSELLRRVAVARAAGNWKTAEGEWWACIARALPRVEFTVDRWVYRKLVPSERRDDLVQESLIRAGRKLVENLESLGEDTFFAATIKATKFVCMTEGQKYKESKRRMHSLDETVAGPDGDPAPTAIAGEVAEHAAADWERQTSAIEDGEILSRALATLSDREQRVIAGWREGVSDEEFAAELATSVNNVQQIRSRAFAKLRKNPELRGLIDP